MRSPRSLNYRDLKSNPQSRRQFIRAGLAASAVL
jgi:hypothetical protein